MSSSQNQSVQLQTARSQQYFNKVSLSFYDALLYGVISQYAWGSSIARLDAHYARYTSVNHLEVGVGTGFLLDRIKFASPPRLALMDLSEACLEKTRTKVARYKPACYVHNILEPVTQPIDKFDSISVNYVMHCVPGSFWDKAKAFSYLGALLKPGGVLFGTTVLSRGVRKNLLAWPFMWLMNALGVFNNQEDSVLELEAALRANFKVLQFEVVGVTAYFAVTAPGEGD